MFNSFKYVCMEISTRNQFNILQSDFKLFPWWQCKKYISYVVVCYFTWLPITDDRCYYRLQTFYMLINQLELVSAIPQMMVTFGMMKTESAMTYMIFFRFSTLFKYLKTFTKCKIHHSFILATILKLTISSPSCCLVLRW